MSGLSPTEIITLSFYAWEIRGRGWTVAPYPVELEPPFRPFGILPDLSPSYEVIDDGKRPTFLSSLVESVKGAFLPAPPPSLPVPVSSFEEPEPYPATDSPDWVSLRLLIPEKQDASPKVVRELLASLGTTLYPLSLDIVGSKDGVLMEIVCAETDQKEVEAQLLSFFPDVGVIAGESTLETLWDEDASHATVDFGLSQEFFLPLPGREAFSVDPYVTLIPMLSRALEGEFVAIQALFQGVRNPWAKAILRAVSDGDGGSLIGDAPDFPKLAEEKVRAPLFAVGLRVCAQAETEERAWDLAKGTGAFFRQFSRPKGNELLPLENNGYPDDAHAESFRRHDTYRTGMILSAEELGALVHFPDASVSHPEFIRMRERTKPLPEEAKHHALILGFNEHRGVHENATLGHEARLEHSWIIGASGSGKSNLLLNLILQDIFAGEGIAVLDPHGDLIDDILGHVPERRRDDIILFDPSDAEHPVGFNILSAGSEVERTLLASDLVGVFRRLSSSFGDTMGTVLGNAVLAILESQNGGTLLDLRRFLVDDRFRKAFLSTVADPEIRFFWEKEYPLIGSRSIGPILTRLDTFLRPKLIRHIVGQKDGKLDLGEVMRGKKVFLAKLSLGLIGEENAYLLGSLLFGKFQELALARQQLSKSSRSPFYLYADEFQNFITPTLETLLTGARKYGLGLTLAHQTLSQLSSLPKVESALFGNAHTRIVFRVGEGDARKLAEGFSFFEADDIARQKRGDAVIRLGASQNDFNVKTYPAPRFTDEDTEAMREQVIVSSRERYGTPIAVVLQTLTPVSAEEAPAPPLEPSPNSGLQLPETESGKKEEQPPAPSNKKKSVPRSISPLPEAFSSGRGGHEHKYLQHLVKRLAEEHGFRASLEDAAGEGRADVVLRKESVSVGVEISVTTDTEHESGNVRKCLDAGFSYVALIVSDARRRKELAAKFAPDRPRVWVCKPEDIVGMLDAVDPGAATTETTVRGYKVKVTRQKVSPEDAASRRSAVAAVIAKSMGKARK